MTYYFVYKATHFNKSGDECGINASVSYFDTEVEAFAELEREYMEYSPYIEWGKEKFVRATGDASRGYVTIHFHHDSPGENHHEKLFQVLTLYVSENKPTI